MLNSFSLIVENRVHTLAWAVESYEQALKEVSEERGALQVNNSNLAASLAALEQNVREQDSARSHLQEELDRTVQANALLKQQFEDEKCCLDHLLVEAHSEVDLMKQNIQNLLARNCQVSEEVASLEQRVQDLLANSKAYENEVYELSASSYKASRNFASECKRLKEDAGLLTQERDDLARRLRVAASAFDQFQLTIHEKLHGLRTRLVSARIERHSSETCRV